MAKASIMFSIMGDAEVQKLFQSLDKLVRFKVADDAMRAASKPMQKRIRELSPDSRKTGSRAKQSQKTKVKWQNSASLKTVIKTVVRKHPKGAKAFVGPSYSDGGGHGNFFSKDHKRAKYWGRDPILSARRVRIVNRFVKRAADEVGPTSKAIAIRVIKDAMNNPTALTGQVR